MKDNKDENLKYLVKVLKIQSKSKNQEKMIEFIKSELNTLKIKFTQDKYDNIIVIRNKELSPFIVAHMDTVHNIVANTSIYMNGNNIFAMNTDTVSQIGIGGDDKVGIWAVLELLKINKKFNAVFFSNEEIGAIGSSNIDLDIFKNASWLLELDRKGKSDFICEYISSKEFKNDLKEVYESYDYNSETTKNTVTDVSRLSDRNVGVSCVNISCGYYNPHSDKEYIVFDEAMESMKMTNELIDKFGDKKYAFIKEKVTYSNVNTNIGYGYGYTQNNIRSSYMDDYYYEQYYNIKRDALASNTATKSTAISNPVNMNIELTNMILKGLIIINKTNKFVVDNSIYGILSLTKSELDIINRYMVINNNMTLSTILSKLDDKFESELLISHINNVMYNKTLNLFPK